MKRNKQIINEQHLELAITKAIKEVKNVFKVEGTTFAFDCCIAGLKVPGIDTSKSFALLDTILLEGTGSKGPHFQKYGYNQAALSTFCEVLRGYGYTADYYCRID